MIVIETTLQIDEVNEHERSDFGNNYGNLMTNRRSLARTVETYRLFLRFHSACSKSRVNPLVATAYINEGYMKLKPLLYPCTIEFSVMSLTVSSH